MSKTPKSSYKDKKRYAGFNYIIHREKYRQSIGDFRCIDEKGCEKICEKCLDYYK